MNAKLKSYAEQCGVTNSLMQDNMEHFAHLLLQDLLNIVRNSSIDVDPDVWLKATRKELVEITRENFCNKIKEIYK